MFSVRDYLPPLDVITGWTFRALAVKLSPGVDLDELRPYTDAGRGSGVRQPGTANSKRPCCGAGDLDSRAVGVPLEPDGSGETLIPRDLPPPPLSEPRATLYEPDPAVIRAGLLANWRCGWGSICSGWTRRSPI